MMRRMNSLRAPAVNSRGTNVQRGAVDLILSPSGCQVSDSEIDVELGRDCRHRRLTFTRANLPLSYSIIAAALVTGFVME